MLDKILSAIIVLFLIVIYYLLYKWNLELEKEGCDCSDLWHREFIKYVIPFIILIQLLLMSTIILPSIKNNVVWNTVRPLLSIITVVFIVVLFDFTRRLKEKQCKCSENWIREFGFYSSLILIILYTFIIVIIISVGVQFLNIMNEQKLKSSTIKIKNNSNKYKKK